MTLTADYEPAPVGGTIGNIVLKRDGSVVISRIPTSSFFNIDFHEPPKDVGDPPPYNPTRDGIPVSTHNSNDANFMKEQRVLRILDMMKDANVSRGANVRNSVCPIMGSAPLTFGTLDNMEVKFDQIMRASMSPYSWPKITKDSALFPLLIQRDVSKESGLDTGYFIVDPRFIENFINKIVDPAGRSPIGPNDQYFPLNDEELIFTESFLEFFGIDGCSITAKRQPNGQYLFRINIAGLPPITKPDTPVGKTTVYWFQGNPEKNNFMSKDPRATTAIKKGLLITKEIGDLGQVLDLFLWKLINPTKLYTISTCDNVVMLQCMLLNLNCVLTSAAKEDGEKMRRIMVFRAETDPLKIKQEVFDNEKRQILEQNQKFIETITELRDTPSINIYMAGVTGPIVFPLKFYQEILNDLTAINAMLNTYTIELVADPIQGQPKVELEAGKYYVSDINGVIANMKSQFLFNLFIRKPKTQLQMNLAKKYTQNDTLFRGSLTLSGYDNSTPFYLLGKRVIEREKAAQRSRGGGIQKGGTGTDLAIDKQKKFKTLEFSVEPAMFYDRDANPTIIDSPTTREATREAILNTVLSGSDPGEYMIDYVVPFILAGGTAEVYVQEISKYAVPEQLSRLAFAAGTAYAEYLFDEDNPELIRIDTYIRRYAEVYGDEVNRAAVNAAAYFAVQVTEIAKSYNDVYAQVYSSKYIDAVCIVSYSKTQNMTETLKVTYLAAGGDEIFYKIFYETNLAEFGTDGANPFSFLQTNVLIPAESAFEQTTELNEEQQAQLIQEFQTKYGESGGNAKVLDFYLGQGGEISSFYQDILASLDALTIANETIKKLREELKKNLLFATDFSAGIQNESQYAAEQANEFALGQLGQSEEVDFFLTNFLPLTESYENIYKKTFRIKLLQVNVPVEYYNELDKALSLIDPFRGVNLYVRLNSQIMQKLQHDGYSDFYYDFINELYYIFYLDGYVRYDDELYTLIDEIAGEFQSALNQIQAEPETPVASASASPHQDFPAAAQEEMMSVDPENRKMTAEEYEREQAQKSMPFLDQAYSPSPSSPSPSYPSSPSPSFASSPPSSYPSSPSPFASYASSPDPSFSDDESEDEGQKLQKRYYVHPAQKEEQRLLEQLFRPSIVAPQWQFPAIKVQQRTTAPREAAPREAGFLTIQGPPGIPKRPFYPGVTDNSSGNNGFKKAKSGPAGGGKRRTRKYKRKQKKTMKRRKQQKTRKYKRRARKTLKRRRR